MGIELIDEALIAGARAEDADVDAAAGINPIKIEKRSFYIPFPQGNTVGTGSTTASVSGVANLLRLTNGSTDSFTVVARAPRKEIVNGEVVKLHVWWQTAATSGIARLVATIKPIIDGTSSLTTAIQRIMLSDVPGTGSTLQEIIFEFPPAVVSSNQLIGLTLLRDPANSLDTLADNMDIFQCYLEIPGRC